MPATADQPEFSYQQIHIDAARNSTDDFNLFHDPRKWQRIRENPFGGPIALGFQLECLVEHQFKLYREAHQEVELIAQHGLRYSNYQITFASIVRPNESITIEIKPSQLKPGDNTTLSNRFAIRNNNGIALLGFKRESCQPLTLADSDLSPLPELHALPDRHYVPGTRYFLKRKFMNTGNAKNFLAASLADQADYFDELENRVSFPEMFPASLISCALLERARHELHDFEREPMVYTAHNLSIDRSLLQALKSNDVLHLLVLQPDAGQQRYHCFGLIKNNQVLLRAEITMMALQDIPKP